MNSTLFPHNDKEIIKETKVIDFLLVDDNASTNFFNKIVIEKNIFAQTNIATNGLEALNHIKGLLQEKKELPKFILLDINMPVMNGWEFLDAFVALTPLYKNSKIVFNLGAKLRDSEIEKIKKMNLNYIFTEKMMSKDIIHSFVKQEP